MDIKLPVQYKGFIVEDVTFSTSLFDAANHFTITLPESCRESGECILPKDILSEKFQAKLDEKVV